MSKTSHLGPLTLAVHVTAANSSAIFNQSCTDLLFGAAEQFYAIVEVEEQ